FGDWRVPQNHELWQGINGINNPCPLGYKIPTLTEWVEEQSSWSNDNASGAFESPLRIPLAGYRNHSDGSIGGEGNYGGYWSSTNDSIRSARMRVDEIGTGINFMPRANGLTIRCIKN
ncbi:MAG: hypothetical protein EA362_14175, partial [Saprospirales bacterium]